MTFAPTELPWLPPAPADFKDQISKLKSGEIAEPGKHISSLAGHALNEPQLRQLSRVIHTHSGRISQIPGADSLRLSVLSSNTFDFIGECVPAAAARFGIEASTYLAPFDQIEQQAMDPESGAYQFAPDVMLVSIDHNWLGWKLANFSNRTEIMIEDALRRIEAVVDAIQMNSSATPIITTFPAPPASLFGSFSRSIDASIGSMIQQLNTRLVSLSKHKSFLMFDVAAIAEMIGTANWFNKKLWYLYKLPFSPEAVPLYADRLCALLAAMRGKSKKCLVLDLDNTCWGGAIGDEGLEGIVLGNGNPEGEAFLAVQQMALQLKERGIILAVCSKNDDKNARLPFQKHPDMLLKESDIAVFQANWQDKASNLEAIAATLQIGIDSLVLLDDNPSERAQTRAALPMVGIPELPSDVALFPEHLAAAGYFETVSFAQEDLLRSETYQSNAKRVAVKAKSRDLGEYLTSLEMEIQFSVFDETNRSRITQLINKSNQFNLTTRRYTESEIAALETDDTVFTIQTRLSDRFGQLGMIGVVIAKQSDWDEGVLWHIDSWLMSCRVLGRKVENAMLQHLVVSAVKAGINRITARYIPTEKNGMVSEHFDKLGFDHIATDDKGEKAYILDISQFKPAQLPFKIMEIL